MNIVTFDVQGTLIKTDINNFKRIAGHCWTEGYFEKSNLGRSIREYTAKNQPVFLDLDPNYFRGILNWMKYGYIYDQNQHGINNVWLQETAKDLGLKCPLSDRPLIKSM